MIRQVLKWLVARCRQVVNNGLPLAHCPASPEKGLAGFSPRGHRQNPSSLHTRTGHVNVGNVILSCVRSHIGSDFRFATGLDVGHT